MLINLSKAYTLNDFHEFLFHNNQQNCLLNNLKGFRVRRICHIKMEDKMYAHTQPLRIDKKSQINIFDIHFYFYFFRPGMDE